MSAQQSNTADDTKGLAARYPRRATLWRLRTHTLQFSRQPLLMGILNVTPDSFSDGGRFSSTKKAIEHARRMVDEGADLLDIGGESTRPYAEPVSATEELRRVMPVIEALHGKIGVPLSIDTSKASVARAAVAAGVEIINDITGLTGDSEMLGVAINTSAAVCAMHMQGTPQTMQNDPQYGDVVAEIHAWLAERRAALLAAGIDPHRICLDPGVGFGKTHQHNLTLLAGCGKIHDLGCPLLVGFSRKAFIGKLLGDKQADRKAGGIGVALALASQGVQILRVHDVEPVRQALLLYEACGGIDGQAVVLP